MQPILEEYDRIAHSNPRVVFIPYRLMARIYRHQGDKGLASEKLEHALEIGMQSPEEFETAIAKIKRDLRRLEND